MFAIIVGYNSVSQSLAESLISAGNELCILEKNHEKTEYLWDQFGSMIMHGDATQKEQLEKAGINRPADVVFALTDDDGANLLICQAAKEIYNVQQTVSVVNDIKLRSLFRVSKVDSIVDKNYFMLKELENSVSDTAIKHIVPIETSNTNLISINIPADSKIVMNSTPISSLDLPENTLVCLVVRDGTHMRPSNNLTLAAEDQVIVASSSSNETIIYNILTGV